MSTLDLKVFTAYCISPYSQGYRHIDDKNRFGEKSMSKYIGPHLSTNRASGFRFLGNLWLQGLWKKVDKEQKCHGEIYSVKLS